MVTAQENVYVAARRGNKRSRIGGCDSVIRLIRLTTLMTDSQIDAEREGVMK